MPKVLITGAARGLGLEFARQYVADGWDVVATARKSSPELDKTGADVRNLDMNDLEAVARFGETVEGPFDLVIANAGIYGPAKAASAEDGSRWLEVLRINAVAPTLFAHSIRPKLADGGKLVAITSRMGSIDDSGTGSIPYRSSKTALNMAWHVMAKEPQFDGVTVAMFHPGWVQTDMGGAGAAITPAESISSLRAAIDQLSPDESGGFFDRDGSQIPW